MDYIHYKEIEKYKKKSNLREGKSVTGGRFFCHNLKELVYEDIVSPIKSRIDGGMCFTSEHV